MSKKKRRKKTDRAHVVSFRVPGTILKKLDAYVEHKQKTDPGGHWSRSSAALNLVAIGLGDQHV